MEATRRIFATILELHDYRGQSIRKEEIVKNFPKGIEIDEFTNESNTYTILDDDYYYIRFYPNGHCDAFFLNLKLKDKIINISSDPISGKIFSKYLQ